MHQFTWKYRLRGWTAKALAERWGMSVRNLGRIAKDPSQRDWDALNGLPMDNLNVVLEERKKLE